MLTSLTEWREHVRLLRDQPAIAMNHDDLLAFIDVAEAARRVVDEFETIGPAKFQLIEALARFPEEDAKTPTP